MTPTEPQILDTIRSLTYPHRPWVRLDRLLSALGADVNQVRVALERHSVLPPDTPWAWRDDPDLAVVVAIIDIVDAPDSPLIAEGHLGTADSSPIEPAVCRVRLKPQG